MSFETKNKAPASKAQNKKLRIGSRVPEGNREWLKHHGIVAEAVPAQPIPPKFQPQKSLISKGVFTGGVLLLLTLGVLALYLGQSQKEELAAEQLRRVSMEAANFHLRRNAASLSAVNFFQQDELRRMGAQIQDLTRHYRGQIRGLEKGVAMSDDLRAVYEKAWQELEAQYDAQISVLRSEINERNKIISTLDRPLPFVDEVLVTAPAAPVPSPSAEIRVAAVNPEFQFVMIDAGSERGAREGQMVELYRGGRLIGFGEIEKIYPDYSGVRVFSAAVFTQIQLGDRAFIRVTE